MHEPPATLSPCTLILRDSLTTRDRQKGQSPAQRVFKNFVTCEGLRVKSEDDPPDHYSQTASQTTNGRGLTHTCPKPNTAADRSTIPSRRSSPALFTSGVAAVPGGPYRMPASRGRWSLMTFGSGAKTAASNGGTPCSAARCGRPRVNTASPVSASSPIQPSRPRTKGGLRR